MNTTINQHVDITALRFGRDMRAIPRRMEYNGRSIEFIDNGLCLAVGKGERLTRIMTMTDGQHDFQLKSDGSRWTLLSVR